MGAVWLLPGMDATGLLWAPLLRSLDGSDVRAFSYPTDVVTYDDVLAHVGTPPEDAVLVAESFSSPAAVRLAHAHAGRVRALVIVAGFLRTPRVPFAGALGPLLSIRPPALAVRALMLGARAPRELVGLAQRAVSRVPGRVLAARLREATRTDVRSEFASLRPRVLWVHGARDRLLWGRATREAQRSRAGLDVRVVDGPHLLSQTRPRAVADVIREAGALLGGPASG